MNAESLSAFMFINFEQALGFGHIAWGIEVEPGKYFYGSTDHLLRRPMWDLIALIQYARVKPGDDVDYWSSSGSFDDMLGEMSRGPHIWYHAYKQIAVQAKEAAPLEARAAAEKFKDGGWTLWDNNCVHQTHRVLDIFGAGALIANPKQAPTPVRFFAGAPGLARELAQTRAVLRSGR